MYDLPDGFVIEGNVNLKGKNLQQLPDLSKVVVKGDFDCSFNDLTSLKGCLQKVGGDYDSHNNKLVSFDGLPLDIPGRFLFDN